MDTSTTKIRETSGKTTAVMPKINMRPVSTLSETSSHTGQPRESATAESPKRRAEWDVKFALALIFLVVLVNASLTMLLGGESEKKEETQAIFKTEPQAAVPPVTRKQAKKDEADLGALAPAAGNGRETRVFISREDKRLLLRQLNATPQEKPHKADAEPGTYHSVGKGDALSIIGGNGASE